MTQPASEPAWHPDPYQKAELRWHDGTNWTEHVHGTATGAAPAAPGAPAAAAPHLATSPVTTSTSTSGKAIASFVMGLLGIPLLPLVFGILALRNIASSAGALTGRWMAIVGIVLSSLQLLLLPILLAVAVPTFLAQKDAATGTIATANLKQVVNGIESCAAVNTDGTYKGCDGAGVAAQEPSLAPLLDRCGSAVGVCVTLNADQRGYEVTSMTAGSTPTTYVERHGSDGTIEKTCDGPACPPGGSWG